LEDTIVIARRMQSGAALAIGLILMTVATLVSVTAMHIAGTEERVAANQREVAVAFMAAEAGLSQAISWLDAGNHKTCWELGGPECSNLINGLVQDVPGDFEAAWSVLVRQYNSEAADLFSEGTTATGTNRIVKVLYTRPTDPRPSPAFLVGLLSQTNIEVAGDAVFRGGAHANERFINRAGGSSLIDATISASIEAIYNGSGGPAEIKEPIPVPSVRSFIFGDVRSDGTYVGNGAKDAAGVVNSCTIPADGNLEGKTYFCDRDLKVDGGRELKNGSLLVAGDIDWNGSAQLGTNDELTLAVFATGKIFLNGERDSYAVWWADGEGGRGAKALDGIVQNGKSTLGGAVVSRKKISRNGNFTFVQNSNFGNISLPMVPGLPSDPSGWRELKSIPPTVGAS
jgi:hypothetical protein